MSKLSARKVKTLNTPGSYSDGNNLYLKVTPTGTKSWVFRYVRAGKARMMGLGGFPDVSLAEARESAGINRALLRKFKDPLEEKQKRKRSSNAHNPTFEETTEHYIDSKKAGWTEKHRKQFESTLATYAYPTLKNLPVKEINANDVLSAIRPIWEDKNETASRVRGRIEMVLDFATVSGTRDGANPARWKGHLAHILPKRSAVAPVKHMEALPYTDMPEFILNLRSGNSISRKCLEFCVLTVARVGSVAGARWDEIEGGVWTIPANRMKGDYGDFSVPLSKRALKLLKDLPHIDDSPYLFPGIRSGHINRESPRKLLQKDLGYEGMTVHGFRSAFRDWSAEMTNYQNHICEMALAHTIGSGVEAAYRRGELLTKRAKLMEDWAKFLDSKPAKVTPIGKARER
ncbi:MAG: tyrosine-type recombinase/integrase [Halioglobus sp.]